MTSNKEIKQTIIESLGLGDDDAKQINEAYVAPIKKFELATKLLSEKTKLHHAELYEGYVEKLNKLSAELDTVDRSSSDSKASAFRALKTAETYNRNAAHLHELYFANISDVESEVTFDSIAYMRLARDFGTFDDWQWDFLACILGSRNGWAVACFDIYLRRYVNIIIDGHDANVPVGCYPIVVIDAWEHAYRDYGNDKAKYAVSMMKELNWEIIEQRVERAEKIARVVGA